jgi:hypothetical protein
LAQLNKLKISRTNTIKGIAEATTRLVQKIDRVATFAVFLLAAISASHYVFGWLVNYRIPSAILGGVLAVFGAYHQLMNALERPKVGVSTMMGWLARRIFFARIQRAGLVDEISLVRVRFDRGKVTLEDTIPSQSLGSVGTIVPDGTSRET